MIDQPSWILQIADLQVGSSLSFDLHDKAGRVILHAGIPISERLIDRLGALGIHSVAVKGKQGEQSTSDSALLLGCFDKHLVRRIQESLAETEVLVAELIASLRKRSTTDLSELYATLDGFVIEANRDLAATLAVIMSQSDALDTDLSAKLSRRATQFAYLSIVVGIKANLSEYDLVDLATATIFHDISFAANPMWFSSDFRTRNEEQFWKEYIQHPDMSAEILTFADGISTQALTCVMQVHELMDGTGFPRRIKPNQFLPISRIASVVDTFLDMINPWFETSSYTESDTLAYLCMQAKLGRFDPDATRNLIGSLSVYPVGSRVSLSNGTTAIVVRPTCNLTKPVVRVFDAPEPILDLTTSDTTIVESMMSENSERVRIPRSALPSILWAHPNATLLST